MGTLTIILLRKGINPAWRWSPESPSIPHPCNTQITQHAVIEEEGRMKGKEREKRGKGRKDEREECRRGKKDGWGRLENKEGGERKEVE